MLTIEARNAAGKQLLRPEGRDDDKFEWIHVDRSYDHRFLLDKAMVRNPRNAGGSEQLRLP